jgi:hypothetical protein
MKLEREWVGEVDKVDVEVFYGMEVVKTDTGCSREIKMVDGWMLPVLEARREAECE